MANLVIPRREIWTQQPQGLSRIDYAGLGKGVQMLLMPVDGRLVDHANPSVIWTPNGNAKTTITNRGVAASFDGDGDYFSTTGYPQIVGAKGTYFQWIKRVGAYDTEGPVWLVTNTGGLSAFQNTPSGVVYCFGSGQITGTVVPTIGSETSMVFTAAGAISGSQRYYSNGIKNGTPTATTPTGFAAGNKLFNFGRYMGGSDWDVNADILIAGFTTEVWTEAQAMAFHANPWQIFAPRTTYLFSVTALANTISLGLVAAQFSAQAYQASADTALGSGAAGVGATSVSPAGVLSTSTAVLPVTSQVAFVSAVQSLQSTNVSLNSPDLDYILGALGNAVSLGLASISTTARAITYSTPGGTVHVVLYEFLGDYDIVHYSGNIAVDRSGSLIIILR